ncbi:MAG: polysulfide reductase NrfD [Proteobacteria bacterium]|jgi:protein NrfD|nr:polysulfide reductase NrfD [Pseudomonadota bacterium]
MHEVEVFRTNELIDPHMHIWGWEVPVYLFLGGLAAGVMVLGSLLLVRHDRKELSQWLRLLPFVAPIAISLGMGALFLDLEYKWHVYRFYLAFRPLSPMSWGAWILVGIYPATVLLGFAALRRSHVEILGKQSLVARLHSLVGAHFKTLAWANVVLGVGLGAYTGLLLGTLSARPMWNSAVLAPLFLVSGLSSGAALMMLFPISEKEHHQLRRWDIAAISLELSLLALFLLGLATGGGEAGQQAIGLLVGGSYTAAFWALVVFAGLGVPLVLELVESRRHLRPTVMTPILILVGGIALRWILVSAGQA